MAYLLKQIDLNQVCLGLAESKEAIPRNSNNTSLEVIKNEFHPIITVRKKKKNIKKNRKKLIYICCPFFHL